MVSSPWLPVVALFYVTVTNFIRFIVTGLVTLISGAYLLVQDNILATNIRQWNLDILFSFHWGKILISKLALCVD